MYGASHGAYGVLHLRNTFGASYGFALAPQLAVSPDAAPADSRWLSDRFAIKFRFDEIQNLRKQEAPCCVFLDTLDPSERYQYELYTHVDELNPGGGINLVPVPYFTHDATTHIARAKLIVPMLTDAASGLFPNIPAIRPLFADAYKAVPKPFYNYLRQSKSISLGDLTMFRSHLENSSGYDYQEAYMASEVFIKIGDLNEAMNWSDRSIMKAIERYGRITSDAACKHLRTLKLCRGIDAAIAWWENLDAKHKSAHSILYFEKYIALSV